jgi:hypothetical protein
LNAVVILSALLAGGVIIAVGLAVSGRLDRPMPSGLWLAGLLAAVATGSFAALLASGPAPLVTLLLAAVSLGTPVAFGAVAWMRRDQPDAIVWVVLASSGVALVAAEILTGAWD